MKTIKVSCEDYLERYFVGYDDDGNQEWLHRFLRNDSERHLHSHPWHADSTILCGFYVEDVRYSSGAVFSNEWHFGDVNTITPNKIHRIVAVEKNTWTHMRVYAGRESHWYFIDDDGNKTMMEASPCDWHLNCKPRGCYAGK